MKTKSNEEIRQAYKQKEDRDRRIGFLKQSKSKCSSCENTGMIHKQSIVDGYQYVFRCDCAVAAAQDYNWPRWFDADVSRFE